MTSTLLMVKERYDRKMPDNIPDKGAYIQPEDIADTILFLASERARMVTGQLIKVSGGHSL